MRDTVASAVVPAGTTLLAAMSDVAERLEAARIPSPLADARWLVTHAAGEDPQRRPQTILDDDGADRLADGLKRRLAREPLQLIVGHAGFRLLEILCRPGVFIPRPETEIVAGAAITAARAAGPDPVVVEPCTGTGAIACAVASEVPGVRVVATDASSAAVSLARDNAARLREGRAGVPGPAAGAEVEVVEGDLLDPVPATLRGRVDVLVANPPYLPPADRGTWLPEVADHDPDAALIGGPDGHEVVDALLTAASRWLRPGGTAIVEIDDRRGPDALATAGQAGLVEAELLHDLTGRVRAVTARRSEQP